MARSLSESMAAEIIERRGESCYLLELQFSGGTLYLTSAAQDISWNSHTWQALGGLLEIDPSGESIDEEGQGVEVRLTGVDLTIMAVLLSESYRGRLAKVYYARFDRGTNLVLRSEELGHAAWTPLALQSVTADGAADQYGGMVLDKLVESTANAAHLVRQAVTVTAGARLWASVVIRAAERTKGQFYIDNAAFTARMGVTFDTAVPSVAASLIGASVLDASGIDDLGGGLRRIWIRGQVDGAATSVLPTVRLADAAGSGTYAGDGTSGFYAGRVQVAMGATEIPYARAVDVARQDGVVTPTPLPIFIGYMNDSFEVAEERTPEGNTSCRITTRLISRLAGFTKVRGILTNLDSHQRFYSADTFFQNVAAISGRTIYWGTFPPRDFRGFGKAQGRFHRRYG